MRLPLRYGTPKARTGVYGVCIAKMMRNGFILFLKEKVMMGGRRRYSV